MINKFSIIYIFTLSLLFTQESVNYDMSGQFGVELSNNQILWDRDQRFDNLLIDKSSTNFRNKFSSFDFEDMPSDSVYVKSKFRYEFGDYGFDRLNIGLKKHSENTDFQFLAMKKSFFGNYSEFANADSSPLSLFYKIDYKATVFQHNLYFSSGYFREDATFIFDNQSGLDTSTNKEFSDFLSLTIGDIFIKDKWHYKFEVNHISKFDEKEIIEYPISHAIDLERNRLNFNASNNEHISIEAFLDNSYYKDKISLKTFTRNTLHLTNRNKLPFGSLKYGIDYIDDNISPNISYGATFGTVELLLERRNKSARLLFDDYSLNDEKVENWDSLILNYSLDSKVSFVSTLKYVQANNIIIKNVSAEDAIPENVGYKFNSDDMLSLKTKISIPLKRNKIDFTHYHNFYDSLISSNRSDIIEMDYHFNTSFINENLGITGKLSLLYLAGNHSDYYFDYFRNMPVSNNTTHYSDSYNIGLDLDISIADVLLTIRLKNALHRLPIDGDYSISNAELFNPMNSLLSFGIIWEFDD